jgi:hypothetical protein
METEGGAAQAPAQQPVDQRPSFQQGFPIPKSIMGPLPLASCPSAVFFFAFGAISARVPPNPRRGTGFIIGKGGRNIDQIEKASGAKLSVSDRNGPESFGKEWVYVQVRDLSVSQMTVYLPGCLGAWPPGRLAVWLSACPPLHTPAVITQWLSS